MQRVKTLIMLFLSLLIFFVGMIYSAPATAVGAGGGETVYEPDPKRAPYEDEAGKAVFELLTAVGSNYKHYRTQAETYDRYIQILKIGAFLSATLSAIVLILSNKEWARRCAILASVLAASIPAADQIFHTSQIQNASWRAALGLSRLHANCKTKWELDPSLPSQSSEIRRRTADKLIEDCRKQLSIYQDNEIEVWVKNEGISLPNKSASSP